MNLLDQFSQYLLAQKDKPSDATVKNYKADVGQFVRWYQEYFKAEFNPSAITPQIIEIYKKERSLDVRSEKMDTDILRSRNQDIKNSDSNVSHFPLQSISNRTLERHLSSLRKFFNFLKLENLITSNPFEQIRDAAAAEAVKSNPFKLKEFKDHLYVYNASNLTIKNYIIDVRQFLDWVAKVSLNDVSNPTLKSILDKINTPLIEEYKKRLSLNNFSPLSINRKLSSIRKYLAWAKEEGLLGQVINFGSIKDQATQSDVSILFDQKLKELENQVVSLKTDEGATVAALKQEVLKLEETEQKVEIANLQTEEELDVHIKESEYSNIPPIRLVQKLIKGADLVFDALVILPLVKIISIIQTLIWKIRGKPIFITPQDLSAKKAILESSISIKNISKEFYSPLSVSTKSFSLLQRLKFAVIYTIPQWYKRYHQYRFIRYIHYIFFIVLIILLASFIQRPVITNPLTPQTSTTTTTTAKDYTPRTLLFNGILKDNVGVPIATQKIVHFRIYDDAKEGKLLWEETQNVTPKSNGSFSVTLGNTSQGGTLLTQQLFVDNVTVWLSVAVDKNNQLHPRHQLPNVALSADSQLLGGMEPITVSSDTKNVVLALDSLGNLTIGGQASPTFQATGGQLTLSGDVLLLTTAQGSNSNVVISPDGLGFVDIQKAIQNTSGGVKIDDSLEILASSSGQSALTINQTSTGPLITASSSGVAKFTVDGLGNTTIAGNFNQTGPTSLSTGTGNVGINGNLTLGSSTSATTTTIDFKGRVAEDSDIIPSSTTGTNDLGSSSLPWDNIYVNSFIPGSTSGQQGWWKRTGIALSPATNADLLDINSGSGTVVSIGATGSNTALYVKATGQETIGDLIKIEHTSSGTITDAIDITDEEIVNAINAGANHIIGTTANIDFTNFDVTGSSGNITTAGDIAANGGDITSTSSAFNLLNESTTLNIGSTAVTRTINLGTGTGADTINIGTGGTTADDINLGGLATSTIDVLGVTKLGDGGSSNYAQFSATGDLTFVGTADTITGPGSGGLTITNASGAIALSTTTSGNITLTTGAATGLVNVLTGNLQVGNGTPDVSLNGEDVYIEGTLEVDAAVRFDGPTTSITSGATTQTALSLATASLTTGEALDITSTFAPTAGGTQSAIDINLTNSPSTSVNTLRVFDIGLTDAGTLANTIYGLYVDVTTANANDTTYAAYLASGNVGIGDSTPDAPLEILSTTTPQFIISNADTTQDARFSVSTTGDLTLTLTGTGTTEQLLLADTQTLNIGGSGSTDVAYNVIGDTTTGASTSVDSDDDLYIEGNLEVDGLGRFDGSVDIGDTASDTITFTAVVDSNFVADASNTRDIGSSSVRWRNGYFTTVDATTLTGTVSGGSTTSSSWTINSDNATADAEISSLAFETGTATFNAVQQWNAAGDAGRFAGYDSNFVFNFPISIISQVSGVNTTFTGGSLFNYGQAAAHAITQASAFVGLDVDFSSNITVPNTSSGNQTGSLVTLKDGGASATAIGFQTAGTFDYGLDIGGTVGTAEIRLSNGETIDNTTNNQINFNLGASGTLLLTSTTTSTIANSAGILTLDPTTGLAATLTDNTADALDFQEGTNNYINVNTTNSSENISFGNATTNPSFSFLGTGAVTIAGSGDGTDALVLTLGDILISNGDLDLSGGDFNVTLDDQDVINLAGTAAASTAGNGAAAANLITATGPAGQATSGITGQTGGAGSAFSLTGGVGGAATGASGSNIGGAGGALTLAGGTGGAATSGTGGAGGAISMTAGAAGTGGNANGGTLTLNSGAVTGSGTSTLNLGTVNSTVLNIGDSTVTKTIDIGGVTSSDASTINIATEGTAADTIAIGNTAASTTLALTGGDDWSMAGTGILTMSASATQTTAIIITDADYTNSLSIGDNTITGTTASIDLTYFDVAGATGAVTIDPQTTGTYLDFTLETAWTTGTLINGDYASATTQSGGDITGLALNLNTNLTGAVDLDVTGANVQTPALSPSSGATTTTYIAYNNSASGAITTSGTFTGTANWRGVNLTMPNITQISGSTVNATGVLVTNGTITTGGTQSILSASMAAVGAGTLNGLLVTPPGTTTSGGTINGINLGTITTSNGTDLAITFGTGWDTDINATTSLEIGIGGTNQLTLTDGALAGTTDNDIDLGTSTSQFKNLYLEGDILLDTATDIDVDTNTAAILTISAGADNFFAIDSRNTTSGVSAVTLSTTAPTIASAATAFFNAATFTPGTVNFSGSTQITSTGTSANNALLFNQPTINRTDAASNLIIDQAANLFINGPTIASHATVGQTETITTAAALRIGAGSSVAGTRGVVTSAYGLYVDTPTGAGTNYAAVFPGTGNVGIGTVGPDNTLVISQDAIFEGLALFNSNASYSNQFTGTGAPRNNADFVGGLSLASTTDGGIYLEGRSDADANGVSIEGVIGSQDPTDTTVALILQGSKLNASNNVQALGNLETVLQVLNRTTALMTILGSGNVGIGDASPDSLLDILSATTGTNLIITNTNATDTDVTVGFALVDGTNNFTIGVDDSVAGDPFKISTTGLGTSDMLTIDPRTTTVSTWTTTLNTPTQTLASGITAWRGTLNIAAYSINYTGTTTVNQQQITAFIGAPTLGGDTATLQLDNAIGLYVEPPTEGTNVSIVDNVGIKIPAGSGSPTNQYGLYIVNQTIGTSDYGIYIAGADTYALWVDAGTSAFGGNLVPDTNDVAALGTTSLMWADLFLASGSIINLNNGDVTLTHSSNILTLDGGSLVVDGGATTGGIRVRGAVQAASGIARAGTGGARVILNADDDGDLDLNFFRGATQQGVIGFDSSTGSIAGVAKATGDLFFYTPTTSYHSFFDTSNSGRLVLGGGITSAGSLLFVDNTVDIGASGATRPRNFFLAGDATIGDQLIVSGAGPHAIGGATDANNQLLLTGSFTPGAAAGNVFQINADQITAANNNGYGLRVTPRFFEAGPATTHSLLATLSVEPRVAAGSAAVTDFVGIDVITWAAGATNTTNATALRVATPTGANNNFSLVTLDGNVVFNENGADADFRIESDTNANLLTLDAGQFTGVGGVTVGGSADAGTFMKVNPPAITAPADNWSIFRVGPTAGQTVVTGATLAATVWIQEPNITLTNTLTNAATLFIEGAATEATNNYALWVDAGVSRLDGGLRIQDNSVADSYVAITSSLGKLNITGGGGANSSENTVQITAGLQPGLDNTYYLGTTSLRWANLQVGTGNSSFAGNVGIGTSTPTLGKLQVAASARPHLVLEGTGGIATSIETPTSIINLIDRDNNETGNTFDVYTNAISGTALFRIEESGNIGINTADPEEKLHISGSGASWSTIAGVRLDNTQVGGFNWGVFAGANAATTLDFRVSPSAGTSPASGGTNIMTMTSTGNVGIGTTGPNDALVVNGQVSIGTTSGAEANEILYVANATNARIFVDGTTNGSVGRLTLQGRDATPGVTSTVLLHDGTNATGGRFTIDNSAAAGTEFTISSGGNVGIGTASPGRKLEIAGGTDSFLLRLSNNTGIFDFGVSVSGLDTRTLFIDATQASGGMIFRTRDAANAVVTALVLKYDGNVGLGLSQPGAQLDLSTDSARKLSTTTWSTGSDARIKTSIQSISDALDIIRSVRPVKFHYTADFLAAHPSAKDTDYYNFIAQEYQQVFPNSVTETDGLLYLNSSNMIPYAIAGIKEMDSKVVSLSGQVASQSAALANLTNTLTISPSGNMGIGTTNPLSTLDVNGAILAQTVTTPTLNVGSFKIASSSAGLTVQNNLGQNIFSLDPSGNMKLAGTITSEAGAFDTAEDYPVLDNSIEAGNMVVIHQKTTLADGSSGGLLGDSTPVASTSFGGSELVRDSSLSSSSTLTQSDGNVNSQLQGSAMLDRLAPDQPGPTPSSTIPYIEKSSKPYQGSLLGIVSTKPGIKLSRQSTEKTKPVALNGRVPVKVSTENGKIEVGDYLTSSSTPGVAMKATKPGMIVGRALHPFEGSNETQGTQETNATSGTSGSSVSYGTILAFVEIGYYNPPTPIAAELQKLVDDGLSLKDYITQVVEEVLEKGVPLQTLLASQKLISPIAEVDLVRTNVISPLSQDSSISLSLGNSKFEIRNSKDASTSAVVASIDNAGNASFSGELRAKKIIADQIEGLNLNVSTVSAQYITNVTNVYNATSSGQGNEASIVDGSRQTSPLAETGIVTDQLATNSVNLASYSGLLAYNPTLTADFAQFNQGLIALGPTSLTDLSVASQLSVGGNLILADSSINVLGTDLEIQPLKQGGISFLSGLIHIDTEGNVRFGGNAEFDKDVTVKGRLAANIISPIPDNDLVIRLSGNEASIVDGSRQTSPLAETGIVTDKRSPQFRIENASGSAVFALNQAGDVVASGSGKFSDLLAKTFTVVRDAQADTSLTETIATASAGIATIIQGETERTIITPYVKETSLIYITPTTDTEGLVPYLARQTSSSFTIQIPRRANKDISVNWWIVN